jgi:hypothetical protein
MDAEDLIGVACRDDVEPRRIGDALEGRHNRGASCGLYLVLGERPQARVRTPEAPSRGRP